VKGVHLQPILYMQFYVEEVMISAISVKKFLKLFADTFYSTGQCGHLLRALF
jgi:hypothetical protein